MIIENDLFTEQNITDPSSPRGQKIHAFLLARAKLLAGDQIDFEKTPVTFVMSDTKEPNAFFMRARSQTKKPEDHRSDSKIQFTPNPLDTCIICVTKGLIDFVDNLDQLDYVLGHELTHMIIREYKIKHNSKGEELLANLHAVDLVYDAGGDPKEALKFEDKFDAYAASNKANKRARKRHRRHDEENTGIDWSAIFDVHMTHGNNRSGIEASLTRNSHLIDDRKPSQIDKSVFGVEYADPVHDFLKVHDYENQKPLKKLKILVDCIDHVSTHIPPQGYLQACLDALSKEEPEGYSAAEALEIKKKKIQDCLSNGYKNYYFGPQIEKKYQQKLAALAEDIIAEIEAKRWQQKDPLNAPRTDMTELLVHLQNKAYPHMDKNPYPLDEDINYLNATSIAYTYFYNLLRSHVRISYDQNGNPVPIKNPPQIDIDIEAIKQKIRDAKTAPELVKAVERFRKLTRIKYDLASESYGDRREYKKFDNLSFIFSSGYYDKSHKKVFKTPRLGKPVPWNNLVEIAKTDEKTKEYVITFLADQGIDDFRLTHGQPYIDHYPNYAVNPDGTIARTNVPEYELNYAVKKNTVLAAYEYVRNYFENEPRAFEQACADLANLKEEDFFTFLEVKNDNPHSDKDTEKISVADNKIYEFRSLYNSIPATGKSKPDAYVMDSDADVLDKDSILSLIGRRYYHQNQMPGTNEKRNLEIDKRLFDFDNPIFQKHFGGAIKTRIHAAKKAQKQKMFEATFQAIKIAESMWDRISAQRDDLQKQISAFDVYVIFQSSGEQENPERKKYRILCHKIEVARKALDRLETILSNYPSNILNDEGESYTLNRFTARQANILADYIIEDRKGIFARERHLSGNYQYFCDARGILTEQIERAISGDYSLTKRMRIVAKNIGYISATSKEELYEFVEKNNEKKGRASQYIWYCHIFDALGHLESSPGMNVNSLLKGLLHINVNVSNYSSVRKDVHKIRYEGYKNLITKSRLLELAARAIDLQDNYNNRSFDELLETADNLISLRDQIYKLMSGENLKSVIAPEHQSFLDLADRNISNLLRKAEQSALQDRDPLSKIRNLYRLHNPDEHSSDEKRRNDYLDPIKTNEKALEKISSLAHDRAFWPEDPLEHVKAYAFAKKTFFDDVEFENDVLEQILDKVQSLPSGQKKDKCLFILLDSKIRAPHPETRDRLFDIFAQDILTRLGPDDGSRAYQRKLSYYLRALDNQKTKEWDIGKKHGNNKDILSNKMSAADKYILLRRVADKISSQEITSGMMQKTCYLDLNSNDMLMSYLYGIGVDYLTSKMDSDSVTANKFIKFLNSTGEMKECEDISAYIASMAKEDLKEIHNLVKLNTVLSGTRPANCKVFFENFWSAPLEARAVMLSRMLKSAVNVDGDANAYGSWERVFNVVMDNLISADDKSSEALYARDIMHSYIKCRSDYERNLILSAMMVANRNIGKDAGNVGKALKLFMENMGPAEIKLGQAISSHPNTPESIRSELQHLKNSADKPARWSVYDWIRAEKIPEEYWKNQYMGDILGSASYYTTIALGKSVLRILRPEAREKAAKGFRVIGNMVQDLKEKDKSSTLDYKELTSSVSEMIAQAARMAHIETDHAIGQRQYAHAKKIYNGVTLKGEHEAFPIKVMDWIAKGKNWIVMERAGGVVFNALPKDTPQQSSKAKSFAKAYIIFELGNILSGRRFDHDRHGAQLCIDPKTNRIGIFDTGAMALEEASIDDQKRLGHAIHEMIKLGGGGKPTLQALGSVLSNKISDLHKAGIDTRYLVEVKKGVLALGDFFNVLSKQELEEFVKGIDIESLLSAHIKAGIVEKMSLSDKMRQALFPAGKKTGATTVTEDAAPVAENDVIDCTTTSTTQKKSGYMHKIFADSVSSARKNKERGSSSLRFAVNPAMKLKVA